MGSLRKTNVCMIGLAFISFAMSTSGYSATFTCRGNSNQGKQVTYSLLEQSPGAKQWGAATISDHSLYNEASQAFPELRLQVPTPETVKFEIENLACSNSSDDLQSATIIANCFHHRYSISPLEVTGTGNQFTGTCQNWETVPGMGRMPTKTLVFIDREKDEVVWLTSYAGFCRTPPELDYKGFNFYRENRFKLDDCKLEH